MRALPLLGVLISLLGGAAWAQPPAPPPPPETWPPETLPPPPLPGPEPLPGRPRPGLPHFPAANDDPPRRPAPDDEEQKETDETLGDRGHVVLDSGLLLSGAHTMFSWNGADSSSTSWVLNPAVGVFVRRSLFLRGQVILRHDSNDRDESQTTFGLGAGIGANTRLSDRLSLMPLASLTRLTQKRSPAPDAVSLASAQAKSTFTRLLLGVSVKLLFHPARHFFLGFGPSLSRSLTSAYNDDEGPSSVTIAGEWVIGVWF